MQRVDGLRKHRSVDRACLVDRLHREQHAPLGIDLEVRYGGRGQRSRARDGRLLIGALSLTGRYDGQRAGHDRRDAEDRDECSQAGAGATLGPLLAGVPGLLLAELSNAFVEAGLQVLAFCPSEREIGRGRPRLGLLEARAAEQEAHVPARASPLSGCPSEAALPAEIAPRVVDPGAEPAPRTEQGLVGDLHGRRPGHGVAIEGEEAVSSEGVHYEVDGVGVHLQRVELAPGDPAARVLPTLSQSHEAQEHLPCRSSRCGLGVFEDPVGPRGQRAGDATDLPVGGERELRSLASFDELGQRVLQKRERPGLVGDVGDDLRDEPRFREEADPLGGAPDRLLGLVGREGGNHFGPGRERLAEPRVHEGSVVEVGPERRDHAHPALRIDRGNAQHLEEPFALLLVGREGEQLLELVDDQDELGASGKHELDGIEQATRAPVQRLVEPSGGIG